MGCFSRAGPASGKAPCAACCRADHAKDDELSQASATRIAALTSGRAPAGGAPPGAAAAPVAAQGAPSGRVDSDCAQQARMLGPVVARFDRYREALPSARAAADMNELGDKPGDEPSSKPCLTRLPVEGEKLSATLGLKPDAIADGDLRDDKSGLRAALYRDEGTGKLILVPRDTQPHSLVDWQANTRNGSGLDTPQYRAMRGLTKTLAANDQVFDIAGYSKGGGLAQEGGLMSPLSQVRVFNSAGLADASLARTGRSNFEGLVARTKAFSSDGDFLTFMNATTDARQKIVNARYLRTELAGEGSMLGPINVKFANPAMLGQDDPDFAGQKAAYLKELDDHIQSMQAAFDAGDTVPGFPPVRAGSNEIIANSSTTIGTLLKAGNDQPNLGKLNQHKIQVVLGAMERNVSDDRQQLQQFMKRCG